MGVQVVMSYTPLALVGATGCWADAVPTIVIRQRATRLPENPPEKPNFRYFIDNLLEFRIGATLRSHGTVNV
jgi:hypothetical protein